MGSTPRIVCGRLMRDKPWVAMTLDDPGPETALVPEECEWCRGWDVVYACAHCDRSDLDAEEEEK